MADSKVMRIDEDLVPIIRRYSDGGISEGIRTMHRIIVEKEEKRLSLEEVSVALRKVVQVEGVVLKHGGVQQLEQSEPAPVGVSVEQVEGAVRKVTQTEGVVLHEKSKGFFRDLFKDLMDLIRARGG